MCIPFLKIFMIVNSWNIKYTIIAFYRLVQERPSQWQELRKNQELFHWYGVLQYLNWFVQYIRLNACFCIIIIIIIIINNNINNIIIIIIIIILVSLSWGRTWYVLSPLIYLLCCLPSSCLLPLLCSRSFAYLLVFYLPPPPPSLS